jgi:hypothetical protein
VLKAKEANSRCSIVTLKALANSSPRLRFGNPGNRHLVFIEDATLKGLRLACQIQKRRNSFRVATNLSRASLHPGFQSKPWAGISQRFQRIFFALLMLAQHFELARLWTLKKHRDSKKESF